MQTRPPGRTIRFGWSWYETVTARKRKRGLEDGPGNKIVGQALGEQPQFEPQRLVEHEGFLAVPPPKLERKPGDAKREPKPGEREAHKRRRPGVSSEVDGPPRSER
jgi:hypothetical protein